MMQRPITLAALLLAAQLANAQQPADAPAAAASAPPVKHAAALLDTTPPSRCANPAFLSCASMTEEQCSSAYRDAAAEVNATTLKEIGNKTPGDEELRMYRLIATGMFTPYFLSRAKMKADTFMRCVQQTP